MKGLTQMMWLMVSAVVIIVVALVVLLMFTNIFGTNPFLDFKNRCAMEGRSSCRTTQVLPPNWDLEVGTVKTSCQQAWSYTSCPTEWLQ